MIGTAVWQRIREGVRGVSPPQDTGLRRVGLRLAGQTIALLLVMIIVLEVVVYVIFQQRFVGTLQDTLKARASQTDPTVCSTLHLSWCSQPGPRPSGSQPGARPGGFQPGRQPGGLQPDAQPINGQGGPQGGQRGAGGPPPQGSFGTSPVNAVLAASDASVVYVFPNLQTIDAHGMITSVLDPQAVHQAVQTGRPAGFTVRRYQGEDYLVYTEPLVANGQVRGAVQTSISEHQYESARNSLIQNLLLVALLGLIISGGISVVLVRRALQPIRLAMQRQRDFVADAAHELRTPLAIMRTVGEVGMSEPSMDELQATIAQMLGENQHLTRLVEDLSLLARTDTDAVSIERRPVDLSALVAETAAELQPLAEAKGVQLQTEVAEHVRGLGDILRLRQLLLILLDNALKHTPEGGSVSVRLFAQGDRARLQVADSGPGIDPADLPHIFNRFYRADRARTGEGTGLGLAIGKWITEAHGGQIHAANAAPHGAVFTVTLPIARHALAL